MTSGTQGLASGEDKTTAVKRTQGLLTAAKTEVTAANTALATATHPSDRIIAMKRVVRAQAAQAQAQALVDEVNRLS